MGLSGRHSLLLVVILTVGKVDAGGAQTVELAGGVTEIALQRHLLEDLGISLVGAPDSHGIDEPERIEFQILDATRLGLALPGGSYRGPVSGYLVHAGGVELDWSGDHLSLAGFELHPGLPPNAFELRAADGSLAFVLDNPHPQPGADGTEFLFFDMDLRLSEQLAARLGRSELAGLAIGEAHVRAFVRSDGMAASVAQVVAEPDGASALCVPDFDGPVDVLLESMTSVSETYHDADRVALAPAVRLQNVGAADVPWFRSIAPDGWGSFTVVGQHPFLVMNLYRFAGGRVEQIGRSDAKHAFFSGNTPPCDCQADQVLFNDCTDLYGASTNANRKYLAPRDEVTASTGAWTRTGSHFDGSPEDDVRDHDAADHLDPFEHRLTAAVADLEVPGAEYRLEAWYVVQGDIDISNSMGHRQVVPTSGSPWTFPFADTALTEGSVLDVWVDPSAPPPGAGNVPITTDPAEGELRLAVISSVLPSGLFHYEYALMNFDFDRQIDSFSVPLPAGAHVQNVGFGDGDAAPGNDWVPAVNAGDITWQAPAGNELDWGTMFNFFFDAAAASSELATALGVFEAGDPGSPIELAATTVAPSTSIPVSQIEVFLAGAGSGRVESLPKGLDCAGDCVEVFADGSVVELAAIANAGSAFARWQEGGVSVGRDLALALLVAGDRDLTAIFEICEPDVALPPQVVASPAVFHACETLSAGADFEVASDAIFRAGRSIALGNGFTVGAGGSFRAEIVPEQSTLAD